MRLLLLFGLLSTSLTATAASLTCDIIPVVVDERGFSNYAATFPMAAEIQKRGALDQMKCTEIKRDNKIMAFCAGEAIFSGGYDVALYVLDSGALKPIQNTATFGTSRESEKKLIKIFGDSELLYGPARKLELANIPFHRYWNGHDPKMLDEGVKLALDKKVLAPDDVISFGIPICRIDQGKK